MVPSSNPGNLVDTETRRGGLGIQFTVEEFVWRTEGGTRGGGMGGGRD